MKKLFVLAAIAAFAGFANASTLWWFVGDTVEVDGESTAEWNSISLFATTQAGYNYDGDPVGSPIAKDAFADGLVTTALGEYGNAAYSFYVEIYNGATLVGKTNGNIAYGDLPVYTGAQGALTADIYEGFGSNLTLSNVPEPTSGLMVLLGLMALGLKRKKELV